MAIDQMKVVNLIISKIDEDVIPNQIAVQGEQSGRGLDVQVTNGGSIEPQPDINLTLFWKHLTVKNSNGEYLQGIDSFKAVDRTIGLFRTEYVANMMHPGDIEAYIQITTPHSVTRTKPFNIKVTKVSYDEESTIKSDSFTALQDALMNMTQYDGQLNKLELNKADKQEVSENIANIVSGSPKGSYPTLDALKNAYPNGTEGIFITTDSGHWYYWNTSSRNWIDGGIYQGEEIGERRITPSNFRSDFEKNMMEVQEGNSQTIKGFYSTFTKTFQSDNNYLTLKAVVNGGDVLYVTSSIKSNSYISQAVFFKDEACTIYLSHIGGTPHEGGVFEDYEVYVPKGAKGVAVSSMSSVSPKLKKAVYVDVRNIKNELESRTTFWNKLETETQNGFYSTISDILNPSNIYLSLKYFPKVGDILRFTAKCDTPTVATCIFWSSEGEKLQTILGGVIGIHENYEIKIPGEVAYVTITSRNDVVPKLEKKEITDAEEISKTSRGVSKLENIKSNKKMYVRRLPD
ncbi:TPA: hypothetical protein ACJI8N_002586, partial [Enterococcus hirae]